MNERDTPDLSPGTNVNGAIIEELVERGGYGTVYRARDKLTGTLFALKFVPLHRSKQWAEREGILAMPFQHKNLVRQVGFSYWPPVLVGVALVGWWLAQRWKPEPPPVALSSPSPALKSLPGQEVAPSWPPPEAERTAAPPPAKETPAVVASLVTRPKDDALKTQQAPNPQGDTKQKGTLSPVAKWCVGAAAAANMACPGAQVRSAPEAEPCPAGAVETMTETLGIPIGSSGEVGLTRFGEQYKFITVREGVTSARLALGGGDEGIPGAIHWKLPAGSILSGRVHFGDGRAYFRFTEARTPTGDTFKVCLEAGEQGKPGVLTEPDGGPETAKVFSSMGVEAVRRFE